MKCSFCLKDKKTIKAHIIPRCFYEHMRNDKTKPFSVLTNTAGRYSKKSWIGLYDSHIICEDCEKIFQKYDNYACKILLSKFDKSNFILDGSENKIAYKLDGIDYKKLKLFFISILWRASISKREEFKKVDVGPFKNTLQDMIRGENPGVTNDFSVIVTRFIDILGQKFWMDPYKYRIDGFNFYRFYLGTGYEFDIKVDKRNLEATDSLYQLALKPNAPLYIPFRENLLRSKEFPVITNIFQSNK